MIAAERWRGLGKFTSWAALAMLGVLLASILAGTLRLTLRAAPSFDGAMNLEVASSIARGEGYRRSYAAREAFPHEIQTGAPYILPAAAVFGIAGVGIAQAQVVNIAYFLLLLAAAFWLARRSGNPALALFAACTVAVIPGMLAFGFGGYGEIPALAWVFCAIAVYYGEAPARPRLRAAIAGVLLALAVITKTVMLIGAGAACLCMLLELHSMPADRRPQQRKRIGAVAGGGLLTLAAMEIWRASSLGGFGAWRHWWAEEAGPIFQQAGLEHGFDGRTNSLADKFHLHLGYLGFDYGVATWAVVLWLALLCLAVVAMLLRPAWRRPGKWSTLAVLIAAFVYMAWWLLITPTSKAWHRRIFDGMICADLGLVMFASTWLRDLRNRASGLLSKLAMLAVCGLVLTLSAGGLAMGLHALALAQTAQDPDEPSLRETVQRVHELPPDAYLFGVGWYSAPRVSLLSGRALLDFDDTPVPRMQPGRPIYFVQSPYDSSSNYFKRIHAIYRLSEPPRNIYALIRATALNPPPLLAQGDDVRRHILAADHYRYMRGFNDSEGSNGRWLSDDNLILLTPRAGDHFELVAYTLPVSAYLYPAAPRIMVSFNGCAAPAQTSTPEQVEKLVFAIPDRCHITAGRPVNVRIEVDNLLDVSVTRDQRPLGILGKEIGFAGPLHDDQVSSR
ncbi:MAG: hypothetical protein KGJ32_09260 [Xanthomonadaceae bacterium]|nr:hypothetical protein [Xanthomonadaceae bacterium]